MAKSKLETLKTEKVKISKEINRLESQIYKSETEPKVKAMIGKCFKCRNSYGSSSPSWWLYSKVIGYKGGYLVICRYQKASDGRIEITRREQAFTIDPLKHHLFEIPITPKQFDTRLDRAIKELEEMRVAKVVAL